MKPAIDILGRANERAEAFVAARIDALFKRLPVVCGFSLSRELAVVDLVWHTWPGYTPSCYAAAPSRARSIRPKNGQKKPPGIRAP